MVELVRGAALTDFPEVARSVGLKPRILLSAAGIDPRAIADPEMRISALAFGRVLESAAEQSGIETFGLRLAETRQLSVLGPVGLLLREEPTVRRAIESFARYIAIHNEALALRLAEVEGQAVFIMEFRVATYRALRQGVELTIGVLFRVMQGLIGRSWRPTVCFTHGPPEKCDDHHRLFGPRVDFRCNFNGIIFSAEDLERPVPGADPAFAHQARLYLDSLRPSAGPGFAAQIREMVSIQLASGRCTADRLAQQLGYDRRTLNRRLAVEGSSFAEILHTVRAELAVALLQDRQASLTRIADLLGFSSLSAFSRWFLAAFGARPSDWRLSAVKGSR